DVHAFGDHSLRMLQRLGRRKEITPVAEAVGGDVQDSHHDGMIQNQVARPCPPDPGRAGGRDALVNHAGATSGPPNSGGFAGFGWVTPDSFAGSAGADGGVERGESCSPRASAAT